ncbi:MAG: DnaB-like helicase C-terminal domain-containing protein [Candidatus Thorarchaeota archaeon]
MTTQTATPRDIIYTPMDIADIGTRYLDYRRKNKGAGIPLGLGSVDDDLIPVMPGELVTILGRPGSGKTGFMMRWARWRARQLLEMKEEDRIVIYASYEQHIEDLHAFHVAAEERINITDMSRGEISDDLWERIEVAGAARSTLPLWFIGHSMERRRKRPRITLSAMANSLIEIEDWTDPKFTIDMVFVDYLQRIPLDKGVESKTIGMSDNLDRLKDGALAFGCPFVVGVQAKREVDNHDPAIPGMEDGQWTSNIEQTSDKILSVVRPRKYKNEGDFFGKNVIVKGHSQMLVSILKQKLGKDNIAKWVYFDPAYNQLDELEMNHYDLNKDVD